MKNSKRTPKTLKGAVLIMVMTVMFVLIFLLAGTIAVVYSAHNRAMVKYEESQAYYTARSLMDAYLDTLLKDNDNATGSNGTTGIPYYYLDNTDLDANGKPKVKNIDCRQGRALEMDIYSMAVSVAPKGAHANLNDSDYPFDGSEIFWTSASNYANDQYLYDWVKQYILDLALGDFTLNTGESLEDKRSSYAASNTADYKAARDIAMAAINSDINDYKHTVAVTDPLDIDTSGIANISDYYEQFCVSEQDAANKLTDTIYYRVPAGIFKDYGLLTSGGSYGKIADTYPDGVTDAIIKVQLLERTLKLSTEGEDFKIKFDKGNREKDHIKVQITVEVVLDGVPTTTSVIYANKYDPKPSNQNALTALGGIDTSSSGFPVSGGMASLDGGATIKLNAAAAAGSVFAEGNIETTNGGDINLFAGESYTTLKDFNILNGMNFKAFGEKTFTYVGGKLENTGGGFSFGTASDPYKTDVLANMVKGSASPVSVNGNLYANVFDAIGCTNFNEFKVSETIYVNNIITKDSGMSGATQVASAADNTAPGGTYVIKVSDNGFLGSDVSVGGKIIYKDYYSSNDGSDHVRYYSEEDKTLGITNKDLVIDVNTDIVSFVKSDGTTASDKMAKGAEVKLEYNDKDAFNFGTDFKKTFTMPDGKNFVLDTHQSKFSQYYPKECFDEDSVGTAGSFKAEYYTDGVLDKSKLMNDTNMQSAEDTAKKEAGADDDCKLPAGTPTMSANSTVSAGKYILNPGNVGNTTVDTSSGKVVIQLTQGLYSGTLNVTGNGELKILIPTGAYVNWGSTGGGFRVVYADTLANGNKLYVGEAPTGATVTAVPNIDVYAGAGSTIYVEEGGGVNSLLTGYVYGPACKMEVRQTHGQFEYYKDGQKAAGNNISYAVIGSVVCGEYKNGGGANTGVAFIDRDAATKKPGEVNFAWTDVYFQRGDV